MIYRDRVHAGQDLARALRSLERTDALVLALPRGGVPVAAEVARALQLPLDVLVVRKLALPSAEETAIGAVASGGIEVLQPATLRGLRLTREDLRPLIERARAEVERREQAYRRQSGPPDVRGRAVVLVDDGLATGSTMEAAVKAVRQLGPARVIVAVPVGPEDTCADLRRQAEVICLHQPYPFRSVGEHYQDFDQLTDAQVQNMLADSDHMRTGRPGPR